MLSPVFFTLNAWVAEGIFPSYIVPKSKVDESTEICGEANATLKLPARVSNHPDP